ncbi:hypothetical protein ACVWVY_000520 [Bradyrhizobium sp. URHC0002]
MSRVEPPGPTLAPKRLCKCGAQPRQLYKMMDLSRGLTIRRFECQCGKRTWTEDKE